MKKNCRSLSVFLALVLAFASPLVVRADDPKPALPSSTSTSSPKLHPELPHLFLAPTLSFQFGGELLLAANVGGTVLGSVGEGLRLGISGATSLSVTSGMEGCSTIGFCANDRMYLGGRAEYHFSPRSLTDFWVSLDAGGERLRGNEWNEAKVVKHTRYSPAVSPQVGLDLNTRWDGGLAGVGVFVGASMTESVGAVAGLRFQLGVF